MSSQKAFENAWRGEIATLDFDEFELVESMMVDRARELLAEERERLEGELADISERLARLDGDAPVAGQKKPQTSNVKRETANAKKKAAAAPAAGGQGSMQDAILAALKDEGGPLMTREIAERIGNFGYDAGGADVATLCNRVSVAMPTLKKKGLVESLGRGVGYALQ